ncbi:ORF34 [Ictalurid herpesvirus 1]|uniref:Uncharacterized protein ORF34 n=1 Tax=Ictalurid herpesvirus 1 (strain Auburn) TaxID=766178 RepID=VG34_ICHVA|nr:ORF34 [Ictalurid herpesvirus 1]Q00155.1 RecName: Full=Uncharacterized protein ORF34 [Ictalurid herpesvirus 1 (strain Auburn)]AAA88137.1 ORF34 [Ictalurid herpesvirus 1]
MERVLRQLSTGSYGGRRCGGIEERIERWSRTTNSGTNTAGGWIPPPASFLMSNTVLRVHGSDPGFFIHVKHVNTVTNRQHMVRTVRVMPHKTIQSNVVKRATAKFVTDKKRISNVFGVKSTRIEFTTREHRSANYTANCKPLVQPTYKSYFNLIMQSHGECTIGTHRDVINNLNYTTYLYGVCNPMSTMVDSMKQKNFLTPFFFSSINLAGPIETTNQLFISMTINTQKLTHETIYDLGKTLYPIYSLLEVDTKFNWFCNMIALFLECFINTPNKIGMIWMNERYYLENPTENATRSTETWNEYRKYMLEKCAPLLNGFSMAFAQRTGQFVYKNCEMVHIAPFFVAAALEEAVLSYGSFLLNTRKIKSFKELVMMLSVTPTDPRLTVTQTDDRTDVYRTGDRVLTWSHGADFKVGASERLVLGKKINQYIKCKTGDHGDQD